MGNFVRGSFPLVSLPFLNRIRNFPGFIFFVCLSVPGNYPFNTEKYLMIIVILKIIAYLNYLDYFLFVWCKDTIKN